MNANAVMARFARDAVEMFRAEYGAGLDFSEISIGTVEVLLNGFHEDDQSTDLRIKTSLLFGAYVGEVIRRQYREAKWAEGSLTADAPPPALHVADIELSPVAWCYKRLLNGPAHGVVDQYMAFRELAEERGLECSRKLPRTEGKAE